MPAVRKEKEDMKTEMDDAERQMRYYTKVHEVMAIRDQETLARYINTLEKLIKRKLVDEHALLTEVTHLRKESNTMRYNRDEHSNLDNKGLVVQREPGQEGFGSSPSQLQIEGDGDSSSDSEVGDATEASGAGTNAALVRVGGPSSAALSDRGQNTSAASVASSTPPNRQKYAVNNMLSALDGHRGR